MLPDYIVATTRERISPTAGGTGHATWMSPQAPELWRCHSQLKVDHAASHGMTRIRSRDLYEAEALLEEVAAWSEDEIDQLPLLYREKAREYRRLVNGGEETDTSTT